MSIIMDPLVFIRVFFLRRLLQLGGTMQGFEPQEVLPLFRSILDNGKDGIEAALKYVVSNFDFMAAR